MREKRFYSFLGSPRFHTARVICVGLDLSAFAEADMTESLRDVAEVPRPVIAIEQAKDPQTAGLADQF